MKLQASKTKQLIAAVLGVVALFMIGRALLSGGGATPEPAPVGAAAAKGTPALAAESLDPRLHLDLLANSESVMYEGQGRNIFRSAPEVEIPSVSVSPLLRNQHGTGPQTGALLPPPGPPSPPPPPPINLKFFGYSTSNGDRPKAFLSQGDEVWIAHEGDVVNRQYKIVRITPAAVEIEDLLNNNHQSIRLTQG